LGEAAIDCGGDAVLDHEILGEALGAFEDGGAGRGAENRYVSRAELVGEACDQGRFGTDDHQIWPFSAGEGHQSVKIIRRHGLAAGERGYAWISGSGDDFRYAGALFKPPGEGVLPPPAANYENFH